jgi:Ca2+-binding RTX toxin-like protein
VRLPTESHAALPALPPAQSDALKTVTLNIFDDGDVAGATGHLGAISASQLSALRGLGVYAPELAASLSASQFGEIDGLGMSPGVTIARGLPAPIRLAGGITYRNVDIVNVMLGSGDDTFTVDHTVPGSITVVQGGGGSNKLYATGDAGGFAAPLLLFGSTSQDGSFYNATTASVSAYLTALGTSSTPAGPKPMARQFTNFGTNLIDASMDQNGVIIYGGRGNALIYGGGGGDQIAGGSGADVIYAGSGNDLIHANDGFNIDLRHSLREVLRQNLPALTVAHDPGPLDTPTSDPLWPTSDQIYGGVGHDIIMLDHGVVDQLANPLTGTFGVLDAYTVNPSSFGVSSVFGAPGASTIVLAGTGQQTINLGHTRQANVIVKNGYVYFSTPDGWTQHLAKVGSSDPGAGGNDRIVTGDGNDVIVAGTGFDKIIGGNGDKIVLADDGRVTWRGGLLTEIVSQDPGVSLDSTHANTITLGDGNNIIFGGSGANTITAGNGNNIVAGANARLEFDSTGSPTTLTSVFPTAGGDNQISLGTGSGVVIGGPGQSTIDAGPNYAVIAGNGQAGYDAATARWRVISPLPPPPVVVTPPPIVGTPPPAVVVPPPGVVVPPPAGHPTPKPAELISKFMKPKPKHPKPKPVHHKPKPKHPKPKPMHHKPKPKPKPKSVPHKP